MTAAITTYTTYADIRAALGVSSDDIEDATLALALYANNLEAELEDIALTLPATYATTAALPTPTDNEARFLSAAKMFAVYAVAKHLSSALPLFAPKQMSDGKASATRFDNPYRETIAAINQQYDRFKTRLETALAAIGTSSATSVALTYMSVVSPAVDEVTGS